MSTRAFAHPGTSPSRTASSHGKSSRTHERIFFAAMALVMIASILLGFRHTYFPLGARPAALTSWVIQVHGALFSLWLLLFAIQTGLVSARRIRWHMSLGLAIYGLACILVPLGILSAADELRRDMVSSSVALSDADPRTFSIVSVMGMVMFGTLIVLSYLFRRKPAAHKRLALYATLS